MSFSSPQTITVDATPYTLNLVEPGERRSIYKTADGLRKLTISNADSGPRARYLARCDVRKVAADPLTAVNAYKDLAFYLVMDNADFGFSNDEIDKEVQGFLTWLTTAVVTDILEGQH